MKRQLPVLAFISIVILLIVSPTLHGKRYAFRDVSHFYLPLFDYIDQRCAEQWLPLWNPLDQCGMPLVGESSTAVLYPIRWGVYAMPVGNELAMNLYLAIHLLIAAFGAAWLAKRIGCSPHAISVAGLVYPLSGSVFALYCNPPFLVGAAWLPWALGIFLVGTPGWSLARIRYGAIVLAMMVLGGDPQSALHVVLIALGQQGIVLASRLVRRKKIPHRVWGGLATTVAAAAMAGGLACVQVAASLDWSSQSERVVATENRVDQYHFSLPPWHLTEILTPYPFGRPFPNNADLSQLIPGEGRMWTPTIYQGGITSLALVCGLFGFSSLGSTERKWLLLAMLSLLFCFGHFGLVWLLQQIPGVLEGTSSSVGGAYWWLTTLVPSYDSFRYPVKWLPVFSIAAAMFTARWIDRSPGPRNLKWMAVLVGAMLVSPLCFSYWAHQHGPVSIRPADEYWGPIEGHGARSVIVMSCLYSAALLTVIWFLISRSRKESSSFAWKGAVIGVVILTACEMGFVARGMLPVVDVNEELRYAQQLSADFSIEEASGQRHLRTQSGAWPAVWKSRHSHRRALEVAVSERVSWFGRWHLADQQGVFNSMASIRHYQIAEFWQTTNSINHDLSKEDRKTYWANLREWLAISGDLHCDGTRSEQIDGLDFVSVTHGNQRQAPPFRIHRRWQPTKNLKAFLAEMAEDNQVPSAHFDAAQSVSGLKETKNRGSIEFITDTHVHVDCDEPSLVERTQLQDGNWKAEIKALQGKAPSRQLEVYPCSYLNQAVLVPPGQWKLQFYYAPWWKWPAIVITCLSVSMLFVPWGQIVRRIL